MEEEKKKTAREIIENYDGPKVRIMEVCGTHTHEIFRLGIRKLLPDCPLQSWKKPFLFPENSQAVTTVYG